MEWESGWVELAMGRSEEMEVVKGGKGGDKGDEVDVGRGNADCHSRQIKYCKSAQSTKWINSFYHKMRE